MSTQLLTCTMCGHRFDPVEHSACQSCPLQKGCMLVCCPKCGYETVDVEQSALARLAARWLSPKSGLLFKDLTKKGSLNISEIIDRKNGL